jgi:hypothetical protein
VLAERAPGPHVADEDEVPGLAEPDTGCGVCGLKNPAQHLGGHGGAGELTPDIAAAVHDLEAYAKLGDESCDHVADLREC